MENDGVTVVTIAARLRLTARVNVRTGPACSLQITKKEDGHPPPTPLHSSLRMRANVFADFQRFHRMQQRYSGRTRPSICVVKGPYSLLVRPESEEVA
jgi:hypothetical protein